MKMGMICLADLTSMSIFFILNLIVWENWGIQNRRKYAITKKGIGGSGTSR